MTPCTKLWIILVGAALAVLIVFAFDMVMLQGRYAAHHFKSKQGQCGGSCHETVETPVGNRRINPPQYSV